MAGETGPRGPRFKVGQAIKVVTPGIHIGMHGLVAEVIQSQTGDYVYRYLIRFPDNRSGTFFGFELEAIEQEPPKPKK
jgi:hypothetical protein